MSKAAGITSMRIDISWAVDKPPRAPDWSTTDSGHQDPGPQMSVPRHDLRHPPTWLSGSSNPHTPPSDPAKFAAFAAATAKHYLGQIGAWEIWNEPNLSVFWTTGRDAAAYTGLLKAVYPAIRPSTPTPSSSPAACHPNRAPASRRRRVSGRRRTPPVPPATSTPWGCTRTTTRTCRSSTTSPPRIF